VLPAELLGDPERRRRFIQEAQAASALEHPHTAVIHGIDEADGITYIAMELIRGEKLRDAMTRGRLSPARSLDLVVEIAEALARAHDKGIVHRDLKPANVMLTEDGHAKVIDQGGRHSSGQHQAPGREDRRRPGRGKGRAAGQEKLFAGVDELTGRIKIRLGAATADASRDRELKDVSTASPEAYRRYVEAIGLHNDLREAEARPLLQQAIALARASRWPSPSWPWWRATWTTGGRAISSRRAP
jgi:serine/threonine protein kinase